MSQGFLKSGGLTTEEYARMDLGNLAIKRNVTNQTDNAIADFAKKNPDTFGKRGKAPFSFVNEEMVKDYQMSHKIDENGVPIIFEETPPPDLLPPPDLEEVPSEEKLMDRIGRYTELVKTVEDRIEKIDAAIRENTRKLAKTEDTKYTDILESLATFRIKALADLEGAQTIIRQSQQRLEARREIEARNQLAVANWEQENQQRMQDYEINKTTRLVPMQQLPNESDEDYQMRMEQIRPQAEEIVRQARWFKREELKGRLKEIIADNGKLEQILNSLDDGTIMVFLKFFTKFKTEYLKLYGKSNKYITPHDVMALLHAMTDVPRENEEEDVVAGQTESFLLGTSSYWKPWADDVLTAKEKFDIQSTPPRSRTVRQLVDLKYPSISSLRRALQRKQQEDEGFAHIPIRNQEGKLYSRQELVSRIARHIQTQDEHDYVETDPEDGSRVLVGFGVGFTALGNIQVNLNRLHKNNILAVRDKKGYAIPGHKNTRVSNDFVQCVLKMVSGKRVTKEDVKALQVTERQLFDDFLRLTQLHREHYTSEDKTISALKERAQILMGEKEAGNDNPELYAQYKEVLHRLNVFGVISANEVKRSLKEFKDF